MLIISVQTLIEVTSGTLLAGADDAIVRGLAIDSRNVRAGELFVALRGEHVDGHKYIRSAIAAGARAVMVTDACKEVQDAVKACGRDVALIQVPDAMDAIESLAVWHRLQLTCPVIGITGSTGKTTTKDFLKSVLATRLQVVATNGNQNNELGVPLTLFEANPDAEAVIVEMAMRGTGQIAHLCEIARPTAGLITNVGVSHMEILGSEEAIASAKGELARAIPGSGRVFLNADDAWTDALSADCACGITRYGLGDDADVRATEICVGEAGTPSFALVCEQGRERVTLPLPGRHNVYNALAAAAVGLYLELSLSDIVAGLEQANFTKWRMETFESASGVVIINDAYNANPVSMRAAIATLMDMPSGGRRVAVLGDMAELGSLSELAHFEVGQYVADAGIDILVTVGERAERIADGAIAAGMPCEFVRPCVHAGEASEVLDDVLERGDTVLVKASRVMGLELVVEGMIQPRVQPD